MAAPPTLVVRNLNGANAIAYRLVGGTTLLQIETTLSASVEAPADLNWAHHTNRAVRYGNLLFVWHRDQIYSVDTVAGDWAGTDAYTVSDQNSAEGYARHTGLYHIDIDGVPSLIGFYWGSANTKRLVYNPSTGWSTANVSSIVLRTLQYPAEMAVYRGLIFGQTFDTPNRIWTYDPTNDVYTAYNVTMVAISFAVLEGVLYAGGQSTDVGYYKITRFTGGSFTNVVNVGDGTGAIRHTGYSSYKGFELVSLGGTLYLFCVARLFAQQYDGIFVYKYTTTGGYISSSTEVSLTSAVVPSAWLAGTTFHNMYGVCFHAFVDYDTDPVNPAMYIFFNANHADSGGVGSSWLTFGWNGESSLMTENGAIGGYGLAPSHTKDAGGQRFWTEGSLNIVVTGFAVGPDGMTISFKAYGDSGSSNKTVKFYCDTDEDPPETQCTLIGSATGGSASRNGNQVDNVDADDGVTEYTIDWDFFSDGGFIGGRAAVKARIES